MTTNIVDELRPEECPGCRVKPGSAHDDGCEHAHCPGCGEQLLMCGNCCDAADRPSIWHGVRPDEEAAIKAGLYFFHSAPDIRRYVPDCTLARVRFEWDHEAQRFRV